MTKSLQKADSEDHLFEEFNKKNNIFGTSSDNPQIPTNKNIPAKHSRFKRTEPSSGFKANKKDLQESPGYGDSSNDKVSMTPLYAKPLKKGLPNDLEGLEKARNLPLEEMIQKQDSCVSGSNEVTSSQVGLDQGRCEVGDGASHRQARGQEYGSHRMHDVPDQRTQYIVPTLWPRRDLL